jgi:hypothetical protein
MIRGCRLAVLHGEYTHTPPHVNALFDQGSIDARKLKRTLHQADSRPQSFIFGVEPSAPGPGQRGFIDNAETPK